MACRRFSESILIGAVVFLAACARAGFGPAAQRHEPADAAGGLRDILNPTADAGPPTDADAPADAGTSADGGAADGHWQTSTLGGNSVRAIWHFAPTDIWVAGYSGTLAHFDGAAWNPVASPTNEVLEALWGAANGDLWAVGRAGTILRYQGPAAGWQQVIAPVSVDLTDVWGSGAEDVWAVGRAGTILRWDGGAWSSASSGTTADLHALGGTAADDVWAGGDALLHWTGGGWAPIERPGSSTIRGIWARRHDDVWAVGSGARVYHYDGQTWSVDLLGGSAALRACHGNGDGAMTWIVGSPATAARYDGGWSPLALPAPADAVLYDVWVTRSGDVWIAAQDGLVLHLVH